MWIASAVRASSTRSLLCPPVVAHFAASSCWTFSRSSSVETISSKRWILCSAVSYLTEDDGGRGRGRLTELHRVEGRHSTGRGRSSRAPPPSAPPSSHEGTLLEGLCVLVRVQATFCRLARRRLGRLTGLQLVRKTEPLRKPSGGANALQICTAAGDCQ